MIDEIANVLDAAGIKYSSDNIEFQNKTIKALNIEMPIARNFFNILIREDDDNLDFIKTSAFSKYRGIEKFEAIWSNELKTIECEIIQPGRNIPSRFMLKSLKNLFEIENTDDENVDIIDDDDNSEIILPSIGSTQISIGHCSNEFAIISIYKEGRPRNITRIKNYRITLKIANIEVDKHDEVQALLEKIGNSIFFDIDLIYERTFILGPHRESFRHLRNLSRRRIIGRQESKRINSFDKCYDDTPMSLYWFGKTSHNLPLFQYLAFYQAVEYYFPIYSLLDAKERIKNIIKDPRFDVFNDKSIIKLFNTINSSKINNLGNEEDQLKSTFENTLNVGAIISFIQKEPIRNDYFSSKGFKKLSNIKLDFNDEKKFISSLTKRIYDIRCKIVHNKATEAESKILPFSADSKYIRFEVELLEYIVREVLIVNSKSLHIT